MGVTNLDIGELKRVSPVVGQIVESKLSAVPSVLDVPQVQLAILAVTSRYQKHLRGLHAGLPAMTAGDCMRADMFLANTARPVTNDNAITAVELVEDARAAVARLRVATEAKPAFDDVIASIVHIVRGVLAGRVLAELEVQ